MFDSSMRPLLALFLAFACWIPTQSLFSKDADLVKLDREVWDFGEINANQQEPLVANFEIASLSSESIEIKKVSASCTCTEVDLSSKVIEPQSKVNLKISLNPSGSTGKVQGAAVIEFNDGSTRLIRVGAYRQNFLTADVSKLFFSQGGQVETSKFRLSLTSRSLLSESVFRSCHCYSVGGKVSTWISEIEVPKARSEITGFFHYVYTVNLAGTETDLNDRVRCGLDSIGYLEVQTGVSTEPVSSIIPRIVALGEIAADSRQKISFSIGSEIGKDRVHHVELEGVSMNFRFLETAGSPVSIEVEGLSFSRSGYQRQVIKVYDGARALLAEGSVIANVAR